MRSPNGNPATKDDTLTAGKSSLLKYSSRHFGASVGWPLVLASVVDMFWCAVGLWRLCSSVRQAISRWNRKVSLSQWVCETCLTKSKGCVCAGACVCAWAVYVPVLACVHVFKLWTHFGFFFFQLLVIPFLTRESTHTHTHSLHPQARGWA